MDRIRVRSKTDPHQDSGTHDHARERTEATGTMTAAKERSAS